jgi:hypothetical protein
VRSAPGTSPAASAASASAWNHGAGGLAGRAAHTARASASQRRAGHRVAAGEGERPAGGGEPRVAGEAAPRRLLEGLVGRLELAEAVAGDA